MKIDAAGVAFPQAAPTPGGNWLASCNAPQTLRMASVAMAKAIPKAKLLELGGAKRGGHFEHHARSAEAVRAFISAPVNVPGLRSV